MEPLDLNDLPKWSVWPSRILGLANWQKQQRTEAKVDREYDKEKYAGLLEHYLKTGSSLSPEDMHLSLFESQPEDKLCISIGSVLYLATVEEARRRYAQLLFQTLTPYRRWCSTVVELGCGIGFNLWTLRNLEFRNYVGADFSNNAVQLASKLYRDSPPFRFHQFNYYDANSYRFFDDVEGPIVIFTAHSIEQIPRAAGIVKALHEWRHKIGGVVHFEPVCELNDDRLFGQLCRRYTMLNDYNIDLLTTLKQHETIHIDEIQPVVFGLNALNPTSVIRWKFQE